MDKVRVRFAPSPTGYLHIGGVRTALFNWLFTRHHGGTFILRIEDTDRSRSTEESIQAIIEGMKWLGLDWDEGPYRQTDRLAIYREHVDKLLAEGKAYHCYCTPEELEARRKEAHEQGRVPKYDGRCRVIKGPVPGKSPAVRFKMPQEGQTVVEDLIRAEVVFDNTQLDDLIIMRSDGIPTYNFTVVVDDVTMAITHVIRGDDHLNNTPRQIQLYKALGYPLPRFAHLSMILGHDKTRLSKRHGATSVIAYRDMGYLPEAMVNYLVRLGWSYGDQEIFSVDELIEKFSLDNVGKAAAVFNPEKLLWLNSHYIKTADNKKLVALLRPFLVKEGLLKEDEVINEDWMCRVLQSLKERCRTLLELTSAASYFIKEDIEIEKEAAEKFLKPRIAPLFNELIEGLGNLAVFTVAEIEKVFNNIVKEEGIKLSEIAQPVRVAVTGRTVSPGIYEVIEILGKDKTLHRLEKVIKKIHSSPYSSPIEGEREG